MECTPSAVFAEVAGPVIEAGGTLESLPDNAATEATVVEGADA